MLGKVLRLLGLDGGGGRLSGSEAGSDAVKSSGQALPQAGLLLGLHSLEPGGVGHGVGGVLEGGRGVDALAAVDVAVAVAVAAGLVVAAWNLYSFRKLRYKTLTVLNLLGKEENC